MFLLETVHYVIIGKRKDEKPILVYG
jgi:hypothetical protein